MKLTKDIKSKIDKYFDSINEKDFALLLHSKYGIELVPEVLEGGHYLNLEFKSSMVDENYHTTNPIKFKSSDLDGLCKISLAA